MAEKTTLQILAAFELVVLSHAVVLSSHVSHPLLLHAHCVQTVLQFCVCLILGRRSKSASVSRPRCGQKLHCSFLCFPQLFCSLFAILDRFSSFSAVFRCFQQITALQHFVAALQRFFTAVQHVASWTKSRTDRCMFFLFGWCRPPRLFF